MRLHHPLVELDERRRNRLPPFSPHRPHCLGSHCQMDSERAHAGERFARLHRPLVECGEWRVRANIRRPPCVCQLSRARGRRDTGECGGRQLGALVADDHWRECARSYRTQWHGDRAAHGRQGQAGKLFFRS